ARPIPIPALAGAVAAQRVVAHRMRKGQAASDAPRRRKKGDACPTTAAQRIRLVDSLAAREAAWRQHAVDDSPADPQKPAGGFADKGCRGLHRYTSSGCGRIVNPDPEASLASR